MSLILNFFFQQHIDLTKNGELKLNRLQQEVSRCRTRGEYGDFDTCR